MKKRMSRRELLSGFNKVALAVTGTVTAGEAAQMVAHSSQDQPAEVVTAGAPAQYATPSLTLVRDARAYLVRDTLGFYAIDAVCPHLGCLVRHVDDGFVCPCHNSQFDADGDLEHGPAQENLRFLEVELDASERLVIHRDREAHSSDRLIV